MCEKLNFETFAEAQKVVNKALSFGRTTIRRLNQKKPKRVYHCPDCGMYHLTSQKKKKSKAKHSNH